ncbi:MAG: thiamine-phosphate pyrophosphorylase [Elusimicrobia bacterium]|nr:thiamine-phosphate pyrophosphorylase [Elusimicrobiota bacterium]MBD3411815.1 thiamine-phosphate pyrophosphorylase [Elusimicrobiota bacterium]
MARIKQGKKRHGINVERVIDANLNRAREAVRVVEDTERFVFHDRAASVLLRAIRHQLDIISRSLYDALVMARLSTDDCGRTNASARFDSPTDIERANMRRAQEAVRVLEEYARLVQPAMCAQFQSIRFKLYDVEKKIHDRQA